MSRSLEREGDPLLNLDPRQRLRAYNDIFKLKDPSRLEFISKRVSELGLYFEPEEITLIAALDNPRKVQEFLDSQIFYNWDHDKDDVEETSFSPRTVLKEGKAHCFEGMLFAYMVDYLHGYDPKQVVLEASQDYEHNLVVWQDKDTELWGANAQSSYPGLEGRSARFKSIKELAESYHPHYYSGRTNIKDDLTLKGYSQPIDLVEKYGTGWMDTFNPTWDMYYTYIDDSVKFHYLFDASQDTHLYPQVAALKNGWIAVDGTTTRVNVARLPWEAQGLWWTFWSKYNQKDPIPTGYAHALQERFRELTGTTLIDLIENAQDFVDFLEGGYKVGQIIHSA